MVSQCDLVWNCACQVLIVALADVWLTGMSFLDESVY